MIYRLQLFWGKFQREPATKPFD